MARMLTLLKKKREIPICTAVIVAAGSSRRMGGIDKVLAPLGELPVIVHTLYVFQECSVIGDIIVVTRKDLIMEVSQLCQKYHLDKVTKVIVGGAERIDSVQAGLQEVDSKAKLIAIHDAARPFLTQEILTDTVKKAAETGASAPAVPITDTIKRVKNNLIFETLDRSQLYAVQTPQVFEAGLIRAAVSKARADGAVLTDDCSAVERLGMRVSLIEGSRENIKITTQFDLLLGKTILNHRGKGGR